MKRSKPLKRSSAPRRKARLRTVNAKRRKTEFARCYHSSGRVEWVKTWPCCVTGKRGFVENAHIPGARGSGVGRKGDYDQIVPLDHDVHRLLHQSPRRFEQQYGNIDWRAKAAYVQLAWQVKCGRKFTAVLTSWADIIGARSGTTETDT